MVSGSVQRMGCTVRTHGHVALCGCHARFSLMYVRTSTTYLPFHVCVFACACVRARAHVCVPHRSYMFEPDGQILDFFGEFRDHKGDEVRYHMVGRDSCLGCDVNGCVHLHVPEATCVCAFHSVTSGVVQSFTTNQAKRRRRVVVSTCE